MKTTVIKQFGHERGLSVAFRQWKADHSHCSFVHGYALAVEIEISCEKRDKHSWVYDFGDDTLKTLVHELFDHVLFVAKDDPALPSLQALNTLLQSNNQQPFARITVLPIVNLEVFAHVTMNTIQGALDGLEDQSSRGLLVERVRLSEHPSNHVEVRRGSY